MLDTHKNVSTSCVCPFVGDCEVVFRNPNCHISVMCTRCWSREYQEVGRCEIPAFFGL